MKASRLKEQKETNKKEEAERSYKFWLMRLTIVNLLSGINFIVDVIFKIVYLIFDLFLLGKEEIS